MSKLLKRKVWLLIVPIAFACAADKKAEAKPAPKSGKAAARSEPGSKLKPGYVRTPFGVSKVADAPAKPEEVEVPVDMTVTEDGDNLRFERRSPFGPMKWVRKKSELTDTERAVWERDKARKAPEPDKSKE